MHKIWVGFASGDPAAGQFEGIGFQNQRDKRKEWTKNTKTIYVQRKTAQTSDFTKPTQSWVASRFIGISGDPRQLTTQCTGTRIRPLITSGPQNVRGVGTTTDEPVAAGWALRSRYKWKKKRKNNQQRSMNGTPTDIPNPTQFWT